MAIQEAPRTDISLGSLRLAEDPRLPPATPSTLQELNFLADRVVAGTEVIALHFKDRDYLAIHGEKEGREFSILLSPVIMITPPAIWQKNGTDLENLQIQAELKAPSDEITRRFHYSINAFLAKQPDRFRINMSHELFTEIQLYDFNDPHGKNGGLGYFTCDDRSFDLVKAAVLSYWQQQKKIPAKGNPYSKLNYTDWEFLEAGLDARRYWKQNAIDAAAAHNGKKQS